MADHSSEGRVELTTFSCKECYVYRPPPASSIGHRAEVWDVDHWLQEVSLKIITCDEDCSIRLFEQKSGALFAECIVPADAPLSTVVEAVIDSSRYFAIRLVDRQSKRHAIIGIGFRERTEASDFNAALYEHTQYLRRKKQAAEMHEAYTARADAQVGSTETSQTDMGLKPGETITLKLGKTQLSGGGSTGQTLSRLSSNSTTPSQIQIKDSSPGHIPLLAPPPAPSTAVSSGYLHHALSGSHAQPDSSQILSLDTSDAQEVVQQEPTNSTKIVSRYSAEKAAADTPGQSGSQATSGSAPPADDWGDFVS